MPRISKTRVEGQSIRYTLNTGKVLADATVKRIYYEWKDPVTGAMVQGFWDEADGVVVVDEKKLRYVHHNLPRGIIAVLPHAEWANGWVSRSPDPVIYTVTALGKKP